MRIPAKPPSSFFERTHRVDSMVISEAVKFLTPTTEKLFALTAVGGYGRRELFPHSDIDLLLLVADEADAVGAKEALAEFLRDLWDAGLRVGHSVRTVAECCRLQEQNIELHISLLDLRFLCGSRDLFLTLSQKLPGFYQRHAEVIISRLAHLARQRHSKFNNTVYHLEPNIKETPGGIRDIHLVHWLFRLAPDRNALHEFLREMQDASQFLSDVRSFIHTQIGRDNNLLTFELQDEAARLLSPDPLTPAAWMRVYYQHARRVFQSTLRAIESVHSEETGLLRQFRDWRGRVSTSQFTIAHDRVLLRNAHESLRSAESVLGLFTFVARHSVPLSWDTQRRIQASGSALKASFESQSPRWPAWRELLSQPHAALGLQQMQETGLLPAAIPDWHTIDSLVVRDFYHRYTVDEHTLVAIESIDRLLAREPGTPSRFHELLLSEGDPAALRLALLLHDLGKGTNPGDHVAGSLESATRAIERLAVPAPTAETVLFLIEHHLDLSLIMNARDLEDPATARLLTSEVGTAERLRSLVLLTYADISAVNPTAMTAWRLEQLWRVYARGSEQLNRDLAQERVHEPAAFFAGGSAPPDPVSPDLARFVEGLPARYLRTHTREEVAHHFELAKQSESNGMSVEITRTAGIYLLTVLTPDRPGLFAALCGALASFGMSIVKAEAASNASGCALDLIRFTDPMRTLELNPMEAVHLENIIASVLRGSLQVADLLKRRRPPPRPTRKAAIPASLRFDHQASDASTLVHYIGEDRPGLLYDLASAFSRAGCNIEVVLIDTEAHKAIDVFYITRNGAKLTADIEERLRAELLEPLGSERSP